MTHRIKLILGITFILITQLIGELSAQLSIDFSTGNAISLNELSPQEFSPGNLGHFGLKLNYVPKKIGLGLQLSTNSYTSNTDFLSQFDAFETSLSTSGDKWRSNFLFIGPVLKLGGNKLNLSLFPKIGLGNINGPNRRLVYLAGTEEFTLYADNQPEELSGTNLFAGLDAQLNLALSKRIGIHLNAGLNSNGLFGTGNSVLYREVNLDGNGLTEEELTNGRLLQKDCNAYDLLNLGAGITIGFSGGKPKKKGTKEPIDETKVCLPTRLSYPKNNESYVSSSERKPQFSWSNNDSEVKHYLFELSRSGKRVYSKKTTEVELQHNGELAKIYKGISEKGEQFSWKVITVYQSCSPHTTKAETFSVRAAGGTILEVFEIECKDPAFTDDGLVHYTAKVIFTNTAQSFAPWVITDITVNPGGYVIPATAFYSCPNPNVPSISPGGPYSVPVGSTSPEWCFDFSVPIGTQVITSTANGLMGNAPSVESDRDSIESCICDGCNDWDYVVSTPQIKKIGEFPNGGDAVLMASSIQILNAEPIMMVEAQIISIQQNENEEECNTCTKDEGRMGLFKKVNGSGVISPATGWQNNGQGDGVDPNNDSYTNKFTWLTQTVLGENFSNAHRFRMWLSLPKSSALSCCSSKYTITVRYTFTDINCQTCSETVEYEYDSSSTSSGGPGGIGTGVGVPIGIPAQQPSLPTQINRQSAPLPSSGSRQNN